MRDCHYNTAGDVVLFHYGLKSKEEFFSRKHQSIVTIGTVHGTWEKWRKWNAAATVIDRRGLQEH